MTDFSAFSAPKGVPDYLPPESAQFVAVRDGLLTAARRAGYGDVELPIFEDTALFARGVTLVGQQDAGSLQVIATETAPLGRVHLLRLEAVGTVEDQPVYRAARFVELEITE